MKISSKGGRTELIIDDNCQHDKFYMVADILQTSFNLTFIQKIDGLDTSYWDFVYDGCTLTLHYHFMVGLSIFPAALEGASNADSKSVMEMERLLMGYFAEKRKI